MDRGAWQVYSPWGRKESGMTEQLSYIYKYVCVCECVCVYVIEYHSAIKNTEILPFAATWTYLEGIMPKF